MLFLDSETCGLVGAVVIFQYAYDDGPIVIYNPWKYTVRETLNLLQEFTNYDFCGFNLTFDIFHIAKMYTTLELLSPKGYDNVKLENCIIDYAILERDARDGSCWKPKAILDLMLHSRKGKFQSLMQRKDVRIKKVPALLANDLCKEINNRIKLDAIFFAKRKTYTEQWQVYDNDDDEDFKDIVLKFSPSTALKSLARFALGMGDDEILRYSDIEIKLYPKELEYAPYALATATINNISANEYSTEYLFDHKDEINWNNGWPELIQRHINHWENSTEARKYAAGDVDKTRKLWEYFEKPPAGDDDSELAGMVAVCRWHGYKININGIKELKKLAFEKIGAVPTAAAAVRSWIGEALHPTELIASDMEQEGSTKKQILETMAKMSAICPDCRGESCDKCSKGKVKHPAAVRAQAVLDARAAEKEIQLYEKLLKAGRLHPDFNVIGALSSRMSGAGGVNAQAINKAKRVREQFDLAFPPMILCGGDFSAFEVVLAIAIWGDKDLEKTVTSFRSCHVCSESGQSNKCECKGYKEDCKDCGGSGILPATGKCYNCKGKGQVKVKIHALFGTYIYKGMSYEDILDSDGSNEFDYYTRAKSGLFSQMYGGTAFTLADRLGIPEEEANEGFQLFIRQYPGVGRAMAKVKKQFQSMVQKVPGGKVEWHEPADYIEEPILHHRRYFTLENQVCKTLFELANKPPKEWQQLKIKTVRRDREQTVSGAVQSALFAAAFAVQSANTRAAINHQIQAAGGKITKYTQRKVWDIQPPGIHPFRVLPMNVHDELETPCLKEYASLVESTVKEAVEHFRPQVPLIAIDWKTNIPNWGSKK